jgi:NAD(P)-dependent dehydrogenase (short-subunit alcohol dehydrogenase family)
MALADFDLTGRKVLITGAGRGIGKGIALVMAEAGADVGVTSLGEANAAQVAREVQALGRRGFGWAADGTSVEATQAIASDVLASWAASMCS